MRQLRGRLDWSKARRTRINADREDDCVEAEGRREQILKEETRVLARLSTALHGSKAFVGNLRKLGAVFNEPELARLAHYATPIYLIAPGKTLLSDAELLLVCEGWDHRERARDWAAAFNEIIELDRPIL